MAVHATRRAAIATLAVAAACSGDPRAVDSGNAATTGARTPTRSSPSTPLPAPAAVTDPAIAITVGEAHACAITKSGDAQCWGMHNGFVLGDGSNAEASPVPV